MLFFSKSIAEVVVKVDVKGNDRISKETILIYGDIVIGNNYESQDVSLTIKKLYESNFFQNISIKLENGILNISIKENPIINLITFDGEKAKKYKEQISTALNLKEKSSFQENFIESDINIIKEFYRSVGFYFVEIDALVENLDNNRVNLIYSINKGKKAKISKIYFLGDKKFRDNRLRDVITSEESRFWKFISRNVYLNEGRIDLDKRLLENYYKNKGYYEVKITSSNVEYSEGNGFVLTYSINSGKRYKFRKIFANVAPSLDKSAFASLEKSFNKVVGEYYSRSKLTKLLELIDELTDQKELQFVNHQVLETLEGDGIDVQINIFEGEKFIIERINIVGNNVTNDSVIRGEMLVDEGDPYSALLVNKSINKLKSRNIFGKIKEEVTEGSSPNLKVLNISIEEKATGEIAAGLGVGTDGTSVMFSVRENNWLGRGVGLDTTLNLSAESVSGSLSLSNPNYNYSGNAVFAVLDVSKDDMTATSGFKSNKTGFQLGTSFEQYRDIFLSPSLLISSETIDTENSASSSIKKMEGSFNNIDFMYGVVLDKRNQTFQPTDGYRAKFTQLIPIVQDTSHLLNGFDVSNYRSFADGDIVGVSKFYARSIHGIDEDVRLTSRIFIPHKMLRGFNSKRVGPKDKIDWVGGNYATALGFEAQLPNLLPESTKTDISVFLDSANLWGVDYDSSLSDSGTYRSSVGMSANVFTTLGPLNFTIAQAISKKSTDETEFFNFRLGTSF